MDPSFAYSWDLHGLWLSHQLMAYVKQQVFKTGHARFKVQPGTLLRINIAQVREKSADSK